MRVVAGRLGGRRLVAPKGSDTRPTSDRVREALFSILGPIDGVVVLDLFAGSGALGIEALSRGATSATFVDSAPGAVAAIGDNVAALGLSEAADVRREDALRFLENARAAGRQYDLVFLDPPYRRAASLARDLSEGVPALLSSTARVICESDRREPLELSGLVSGRPRLYGDTVIAIHEPQ